VDSVTCEILLCGEPNDLAIRGERGHIVHDSIDGEGEPKSCDDSPAFTSGSLRVFQSGLNYPSRMKRVLAAVSGNTQLWKTNDLSFSRARLSDSLTNIREVSLPREWGLIESGCCDK
jgi:hypothetical protein